MSADTLRRAAKTLREHAEAATPGPWYRYADEPYEVITEAYDTAGGEADPPCPSRGSDREADSAYIKLMHPPVALALAAWFESEADWRSAMDLSLEEAYTLARAILREKS